VADTLAFNSRMAATDDSLAVVAEDVSKAFRLPHERVSTLKERALHPFRRSSYQHFDALKDVSFAVPKGEFFGIVGRNGSGKSTLLKCLAGIYRADSGGLYVDGRISTFIELGVGFNPDLAARDNVLINGVMLGLSPREALARYDSVIEFAELRQFEDLKLKNYSSGMQVRLAFSVMIQVDADVLLIDEVLAVGDASFQQKCFDTFNRLRDEGRTILFVTHDMGAVRRFCHRAMLIERGEVRTIGEPQEVAAAYVDLNFERGSAGGAGEGDRGGDRGADLIEAWWEDDSGERVETLHQGTSTTFRARVRFETDVRNPAVAVVFENEHHQPLLATSTEWTEGDTGLYKPGDEVTFSVSFDMAFAPGRIYASPWVLGEGRLLDRRPRMINGLVIGIHVSGGLVDLPHEVRLESADRVLAGSRELQA
jgi:ABC-type polysaccharide/polyol phosphate transport system ATPase subunit